MSTTVRLSFAAVALGLVAQFSCTPAIPKYTIKYAEKRAVLKNGLRLVVIPDKSTPLVQVDVRYEVGSNEDPPGKAGLAHLVEHMMFQHRFLGPNKPATFQLLPQIATTFNAYTNWDTTHYFLRARKEGVDGLLRLEAARMNAGCKTIPQKQFEREREVVRNEIRQRLGTPEGQVPQLWLSAVYPKGHPYEQLIGGNDKQLSSITLKDVCDFMEKYYVPSRATVIVVGNVDVDKIGKKVAFMFGGIKARKPAPRVPVKPITTHYRKLEYELDVPRSSVSVIWPLPSRYGPDGPAANVLIGQVTRMVSAMGREYKVAASVQPGVLGGAHAPIFVISVELYNYSDRNEALEFIWKAAKNAHRGMESGDIDFEAKNRFKASFITQLESLAARANLVADLIQFRKEEKFQSDKEYIIEELKRIDKLDAGRFSSFIKRTLKKSNATVVVVKAKEGAARGDKRSSLSFKTSLHDKPVEPVIDPKEAHRPLTAPATDSALVKAVRYKLGNGMRVVLLPFSSMPIVTANLMFDVGAAHEPPSKAGLATFAARFLSMPPGSNVGKLGIGIDRRSVSADHTSFTSRSLEIYLPQQIKMMERFIKAGVYSQRLLEAVHKRFADNNKLPRVKQRRVFGDELGKAIYGLKHPYAKPAPTPKSVRRIGRDAAHAWRNKHYTAKNATLILAGSFDIKRAKKAISSSFGEWSGGHHDQPVTEPAIQRKQAAFIGVVGEQLPQMQVAVAYPSTKGVDEQYAARLVLQGMLNLRMAKIRSELGSTYGAYARRTTRVGPSFYVMAAGIDVKRAGESLAKMRFEIEELRKGNGFDLDFARSRRIVLKRLMGQSTESFALAGRLAQIAAYGQAPDFYEKLTKRVAAVTPAQVRALIATELKSTNEVVVCLADKPSLEKAFDEAKITSVKYVDPDQQ